jgi:hypothetical protein
MAVLGLLILMFVFLFAFREPLDNLISSRRRRR